MALSKIEAPALDVGQIGGRRNLIINGAMQVAQRGTSFSSSATGGGRYTVDRWSVPNRTRAVQSSDAPTGFKYSLFIDREQDAGIEPFTISTGLETQDIVQTGTYTLSFYAKSPTVTTVNVNVQDRTNVSEGGTNNESFLTDEAVTITSSWARYSVNFTLSDVVFTGTSLRLSIGNTTAALTSELYITGVQLEVGSVATPFEHRSYGEELALCQRYYQVFLSAGDTVNSYYGIGHFYVAGALIGHIDLQTTMRTVPSIVSTNSSAQNFRWFSAGTSGFYGGHTFNDGTPNHVGVNCMNDLTDGTQGNPAGLSKYASASYLHFNAEL